MKNENQSRPIVYDMKPVEITLFVDEQYNIEIGQKGESFIFAINRKGTRGKFLKHFAQINDELNAISSFIPFSERSEAGGKGVRMGPVGNIHLLIRTLRSHISDLQLKPFTAEARALWASMQPGQPSAVPTSTVVQDMKKEGQFYDKCAKDSAKVNTAVQPPPGVPTDAAWVTGVGASWVSCAPSPAIAEQPKAKRVWVLTDAAITRAKRDILMALSLCPNRKWSAEKEGQYFREATLTGGSRLVRGDNNAKKVAFEQMAKDGHIDCDNAVKYGKLPNVSMTEKGLKLLKRLVREWSDE